MVSASFRIIFIMLFVFTAAMGRAYGKTDLTVEPNIGRLFGYTSYHISVPGVASELEWPVSSTIAGLHSSVNVDNKLAFGVTLRKNLDTETGKMKDSDWLNSVWFDNYFITNGFIYSESDTEMEMLDIDFRGKYTFQYSKDINIGLMAGFRRQEFSFKANNVIQQSWNIPPLAPYISSPGLSIKYDVRYSIPYIGAGFNSKIGEKTEFDLSAQLGYVNATDEDDHVLRYKKSTGDCTGSSVGLSGNLVYNLSPKAFIKLDSEYLYINADGKQTQTWYANKPGEPPQGTTITDIDLKIKSFQGFTTIGVGMRF